MKHFVLLFSFFFCIASLFAQTKPDIALIRQGNGLIGNKKYNEAEICYRKALAQNPKSAAAAYNLALSLQLQKKTEEALKQYENAILLTEDKSQKSSAYHNIGNAYCASQEWEKAIEKYKAALRINPSDMDTKYNLAFAQNKLKQQQQQQQDQQNKKDDKSNGDKDEKNKENSNNGGTNKKDKEPSQKPGEMTKDQAKKMLNAIQAQEAKVNDKMQKGDKKAVLVGKNKDW
jgi:Ca-activated chloride channel family protein